MFKEEILYRQSVLKQFHNYRRCDVVRKICAHNNIHTLKFFFNQLVQVNFKNIIVYNFNIVVFGECFFKNGKKSLVKLNRYNLVGKRAKLCCENPYSGTDFNYANSLSGTRNGRNGQIFTSEGTINIRNKKWEDDFSPIDPEGTAFVDHVYTKAYLHHLTICQEMLGAQIASLHNIAFYLRLVTEARRHIGAGDFTPWKERMVAKLGRRL